MGEKLLTIREVAKFLGITEKDIIDLAEAGTIPAYKVGGVYLRFKREQVEEYKKQNKIGHAQAKASFADAVADFLYFNDFYLLSALIIIGLLYIVIFT